MGLPFVQAIDVHLLGSGLPQVRMVELLAIGA